MVSTVRFSRGGVVDNFGLPQLSKQELDLLERAALQIKERELMALEYIEYIENTNDHPNPPSFTQKEKHDEELLKQKVIR